MAQSPLEAVSACLQLLRACSGAFREFHRMCTKGPQLRDRSALSTSTALQAVSYTHLRAHETSAHL
eukprot:3352024-Alexandrium_andersonii.AAC.1